MQVAKDGEEALALLLAPGAHWDLVFCDLMMPIMNGVELARRLGQSAPDLLEKVIFVSGGATTAETARFLAETSNATVSKPFDMETLLALVDARLARPKT